MAAWVLLAQAARVGYNTDEGQHIATAGYFDVVFLHGQLTGPPWEETYWTLTQPTIPRYILGAAIHLSGNPVPRLDLEHRIEEARGPNRERYLDPAYYRDERRLAEARRIERPSPAVLQAGRVPMALFGAGAALLLFLIARALGGLVGGIVATAGLLTAPLALQLLPRAHAEGPLIFFTLLGLYLAIFAARTAKDAAWASVNRSSVILSEAKDLPDQPGRSFASLRMTQGQAPATDTSQIAARPVAIPRYLLFGALAGIATGLAAATKLPAVLGMAALGAFAVWALVLCWPLSRTGAAGTPAGRAASDRTWRWAALATALALVVFVGVNPFMWPNPVQRTLAILQFRQQEAVGQRALNEELAVPDHLPTRATLLLSETFVRQMPVARRTGVPLEAALALVGAGALARRALRARDRGGLVGPEALTLAWVLAFLAGTAPNLAIDWDRYYLPTLSLGLVLVGVGANVVAGASGRAWRRLSRTPGPDRATVAAPS